MAGFIEGIDRGQSTLFPERLEDWVGEDHLVRVVDLFVEAAGLVRAGVRAHDAGADGAAGLSPGGPAQALRLRLPEPGSLQPPAGARGRAQRRADVADRPPGAGSQDDRRFPARQWPGHPADLRAVRRALPPDRRAAGRLRRHRRQQVQGGEQPRPELHEGQDRQPPRPSRGRASRATSTRWSASTGRRTARSGPRSWPISRADKGASGRRSSA